MIYVLWDYKIHLKKTEVLVAEATIAFVMAIDMFLYSMVKRFKISITLLLEWFLVLLYVTVFLYIVFKGINSIDEDIEVSLMIFRLILQFMRFGFFIIRMKESKRCWQEAQDLNLELSKSHKTKELVIVN